MKIEAAEVRQMLQRAAESGDVDEMRRAGAAAFQNGVSVETTTVVEQVARDHPDHAPLWQLLGLFCHQAQDLGRAAEAFGKAAELWPDEPATAHYLASARFEAGLPAAQHFQRARQLEPANRVILLRHAAALIAEGESEVAIASIEQELLRNPGWVEGHAALARVRWAGGASDSFTDSFERALPVAGRHVGLWAGYIQALVYAGLHERALSVIARGRSAAGPNRTFDAAEALSRSELGDLAAAEAVFRQLAPLDSVPIIVHYLRFLLRAGRPKEAAAIGEKSVSQDSSNQIWPYLSIAWRLLGDRRWAWLEGDPRFIGVYDIGERLPPLDSLAEALRAIHRTLHQPLDQSVRGGTQTEGHLFARADPQIRMLRQTIVEVVERHVAQLPPPEPNHPLLLRRRAPIQFSGSWSVRLDGGGRHVDHVHPSGWLSSALYIALPAETERGPAEAGWLTLGEAGELGLDLPPIRMVEPKPGRLVLFPSTMWHGTRPFEAGERLTVAFDVKRPV